MEFRPDCQQNALENGENGLSGGVGVSGGTATGVGAVDTVGAPPLEDGVWPLDVGS